MRITDASYGSTLPLLRCAACGFIFADPATFGSLLSLYEDLDDASYETSDEWRAVRFNWLLDVAERHHPRTARVLDIGAATGLLVSLARRRGWHAEGVEPSRKMVAIAFDRHGIGLLQGTVPHPQLGSRRFDAVFMIDVLEHVSDPVALLAAAANVLDGGGIVVVVTPDVGSVARRLFGRRWWHFRPAHVGYFDRASFATACGRVGLQIRARMRARSWFTVDYLLERVERYLPVAMLRRAVHLLPGGRALGRRVVPLNLRDSWLFICQRPHAAR